MFLDFLPPTITCRGRRLLSSWRSFVLVPSRPLSHQETHVIRTEGFENLAPHLPSLSLLSKYCFVLAMIVLSLAFHPLLLLLSHFPAHSQRMHTNFAPWRAISLVCLRTSSLPAYLYNIVHAFWRKNKDCGSTNAQSEQREETQNSVTTEEVENGTSVTSSTARTSSQETSSHQAPPRDPATARHRNTPSLFLDYRFQRPPQKHNPHFFS